MFHLEENTKGLTTQQVGAINAVIDRAMMTVKNQCKATHLHYEMGLLMGTYMVTGVLEILVAYQRIFEYVTHQGFDWYA